MASVYGQPDGEYDVVESVFFVESVKIPMRHRNGYKLHISVHADDADRLARTVLPTLRLFFVRHKVAINVNMYRTLNADDQRGKFVTVYAGPADQAQRVVDALDPALTRLRAEGVRPGPVPTTRQSDHGTAEIRVGRSGMISTYWSRDFYRD